MVTESRVWALTCVAVYLTVAALLDFRYLVFPGDANARMANGFYVLYSNDPHLGSIGFIWNPLQSVLDMVPLAFKGLWPALSANDFAASLVSVLCMTGAVWQLRAALAEWGVSRLPRLIIVAAFAFNPMILFYAGNGMSEGLYLFTLVATCRYLARWLQRDDVKSLAYAATALGLCYLTRIEAVSPALFAAIAVVGVSYRRAVGRGGTVSQRACSTPRSSCSRSSSASPVGRSPATPSPARRSGS